jgi:hypothetical protein
MLSIFFSFSGGTLDMMKDSTINEVISLQLVHKL